MFVFFVGPGSPPFDLLPLRPCIASVPVAPVSHEIMFFVFFPRELTEPPSGRARWPAGRVGGDRRRAQKMATRRRTYPSWRRASGTRSVPPPFPQFRMARETQRQALFFGLGKLTEPLPFVVVVVVVFTG